MVDFPVMKPSAPLTLHLYSGSDELPADGASASALAGAEARVSLAANAAAVHVALPDRSRAELRWIVDKLLRNVVSVSPAADATIHAASGVDDDTALAIGLDLHHRTAGKARIAGRDALDATLREVGGYEDLFRAWVNEDSATRTSIAIATDVSEWAGDRADVEVTVMGEDDLRERGLRLLLAVGQGADTSPSRLVIARYKPSDERPPLMLLGKGVTFDTGGINVKPYESYVPMMKNDMAGAALAYSLFRALVESGHDEPLLLVIPTCENAVGARSMKPGAVVKSYRGVTVRIDHTDAEGRLILADGLAYATDTYAPRQVICFATLTTAALIAYGPYATPVHFADADFEARLRAASDATGEDMHFFPERAWHTEANRDREADIRNTARLPGDASRGAGSRNAAHFLKYFTDRPLCHLDIFASTWNWSGEAPGAGYGATGAPLRTLLRALRAR